MLPRVPLVDREDYSGAPPGCIVPDATARGFHMDLDRLLANLLRLFWVYVLLCILWSCVVNYDWSPGPGYSPGTGRLQ